MSKIWTLTKVYHPAVPDQVLATIGSCDVKAYSDFESAKVAFRDALKDIGDTENIKKTFIENMEELCLPEDDEYDNVVSEEDILTEAQAVLKRVIARLLSGEEIECQDREAEFSVKSARFGSASYEKSEGRPHLLIGGFESLAVEMGCHPWLDTNCIDMGDPDGQYYLGLRNWFDDEYHLFFYVQLEPTELN